MYHLVFTAKTFFGHLIFFVQNKTISDWPKSGNKLHRKKYLKSDRMRKIAFFSFWLTVVIVVLKIFYSLLHNRFVVNIRCDYYFTCSQTFFFFLFDDNDEAAVYNSAFSPYDV